MEQENPNAVFHHALVWNEKITKLGHEPQKVRKTHKKKEIYVSQFDATK